MTPPPSETSGASDSEAPDPESADDFDPIEAFLDDDPEADRDRPLEPDEHAAQVAALLDRFGADGPRRILDLGCGGGRILRPLAAAGHHLTGLDRDLEAFEAVHAGLAEDAAETGDAVPDVRLVSADLVDPGGWPDGPFDAVLCLGHTFVEIADVDQAVDLLAAAAERLAPGGVVILDDLPGMLWPAVASGDWIAGVSEDGRVQMTWAARDSVIAVRCGDRVDPDSTEPTPDDRPWRLWSDGALRLAARLAGLSAPEAEAGSFLLVMRDRQPGDGGG